MLIIRMLGRFEIVQDDQILELPVRAAQALLAWLVLFPEIDHRRERLAGLLWPESSPENALPYLRRALWRLRQVMPDSLISASKLSIRWQGDSAIDCDALRLLAAGNEDLSVEGLSALLDICAGELLPGFYDEWVLLERERLAAIYEAQMARLLDMLILGRRWHETVDWAEKWIARGYTPEPAYRSLMIAHAGLGNRPAALAAYQRCVEALERELGVPPSRETEALADSIRNSQFTIHKLPFPSPPSPYPQSPISASPPTNLPAPTTPLVGRESELEALTSLLADPQQRLVTIVGPGGMGKTRLALAAAQGQTQNFAEGVFYVPLTAADSSASVVSAIAANLGFSFQTERRSALQQLLEFLRNRQTLLLLDNFEQVEEGAPLLLEILETAPGVRLLITSRERLHLGAETLLHLEGLDFPHEDVESGEQMRYGAVRLFVESAKRLGRKLARPTEIADVIRICQLVGGMPLGILLAAGWVDVYRLEEIVAEVSRSLAFLHTDLRDMDPRHRSIAAVFQQSLQRLSTTEQNVFHSLSVFHSPMSRGAAKAVADASPAALQTLVSRSLLQRTPAGEFQMHELIRQFARERLAVSPEREEPIRARHAAFYATFLAEKGPDLRKEDRRQLQAIQTCVEDVRAAWRWASTRQQTRLLDEMCDCLFEFEHSDGRLAQAEADFAYAAEALTPDPHADSTRIRILSHLAHIYDDFGDRQRSQDTLDAAIELSNRQPEDAPYFARNRALLLHMQGGKLIGSDREAAYRHFQEALTLFRLQDDPFRIAGTLLSLGWVVRHMARYDELVKLLDEGIAICRRHAYRSHLAHALDLLAFAAVEQGQLEAAEAHLVEALTIAQEISNPGNVARSQRGFGVIQLLRGRFAQGSPYLDQAEAGYREMGHRSGQVFTTTWQAFARMHQGRYHEAAALAARGTEEGHSINHRGVLANGLLILGQLRLVKDDFDGALSLFQESVTHFEKLQQRHELAIALATLAYTLRSMGNHPATVESIHRAMRLAPAGAFFPRAVSLPVLALLLADRGQPEQAAELHALAWTFPYIANSRWFHDVAGKELETVAAALPADIRAAAEERGRARTLAELTDKLIVLMA